MDQMTAAILVFTTAIATALAGQMGRAIWSKLFGSNYVTEEKCQDRRQDCHRKHVAESSDAAKELREIRGIMVLICQKMGIELKEYKSLIK